MIPDYTRREYRLIENDGEYYPLESVGEQVMFVFWLFFGVASSVGLLLLLAI